MNSSNNNPLTTKPSCYYDGSSESTDNESCSQEESWESSHPSSCSSCSESHSADGSFEWETEIRSNGELYYIESDRSILIKSSSNLHSMSSSGPCERTLSEPKEPVPKLWRGGGKLVRLIRRRESKRHHNNAPKDNGGALGIRQCQEPSEAETGPSSIRKSEETVLRMEELFVDPWAKPNLGRRATISETLLGLATIGYEDGVLVTDFVPDGPATKLSSIKIGDKITTINGKDVSVVNFNALLEAINAPMTIYLGICSNSKISADKRINSNLDSQWTYQTPLAESISKLSSSRDVDSILLQAPVGVLYLQLDDLTEGGPEDQGILHCYPGTYKTNFLGPVRGAFLTLFQLIPDVSSSIPKSSSITVNSQLVHVVYISEGRELLLIAVPSSKCSLSEAEKQCAELVRFLQFTHQSLARCFSSKENNESMNHYLSIFLSRILLNEKWVEAFNSIPTANIGTKSPLSPPQFESIVPAAHMIPLPREAQIQIDDALSELESNDIGDSCDDFDCQRLYTILGSCLYHKGYLLASHFMHDDLLDVHAFCRQQGLLHLTQSESVRSLIIWKQVYPSSVLRGLRASTSDLNSIYSFPGSQWYIMIVGQKQDLLVTLLEAGGCSVSSEKPSSPDNFYIEAAQDTLQHLRTTGIFNIASEWIESHLRPKIVTPEAVVSVKVSNRKANTLLGLRVHHDPLWQNSFSSMKGTTAMKSTDSLTTGKRRPSPDYSSSGPLHTGETSEDSASLVASLPSDDTGFLTVKSRMERDLSTQSDHDESEYSDSDWEASDTQTGRRPLSTTDLSDLHSSLLKNVEGTVPSKLTMGLDNIAFHYVHIDTSEGVLLSPVHSTFSVSFLEILSKFRQSAMHMHKLFQSTISFKKLKSAEASHSLINKSLVATKECGALFECSLPRGNEKVQVSLTYWVVGRLFLMPTPREVYVCYEDSAPQNLVELAFRLTLSTVG